MTTPQTPATEAEAPAAVDTPKPQAPAPEAEAPAPDTFPREYVEELRKENGNYRTRAAEAEARANERDEQLFTALVKLDGRLADPSILQFDPALLDAEALESKITEVIDANPRLGRMAVVGDIGQGARGGAKVFDLIEFIKSQN